MPADDIDAKISELDDLMVRMQHLKTTQSLLKKFGLTATQGFILWRLSKCNQCKASDLAKAAGLSPGAVTQVCDELVRSGLVERARSTDDRRVVYIVISDAGTQLLSKVQKERHTKMRKLMEQLGPDGDTLIQLTGRVVAFFEQQVGL